MTGMVYISSCERQELADGMSGAEGRMRWCLSRARPAHPVT